MQFAVIKPRHSHIGASFREAEWVYWHPPAGSGRRLTIVAGQRRPDQVIGAEIINSSAFPLLRDAAPDLGVSDKTLNLMLN
jgi:hypothetical protein